MINDIDRHFYSNSTYKLTFAKSFNPRYSVIMTSSGPVTSLWALDSTLISLSVVETCLYILAISVLSCLHSVIILWAKYFLILTRRFLWRGRVAGSSKTSHKIIGTLPEHYVCKWIWTTVCLTQTNMFRCKRMFLVTIRIHSVTNLITQEFIFIFSDSI